MWSVLELAGYRRLFISAAIVIFGVMGQAVARAWLARDLTGSNAGLGGVLLVFGLAMLLSTPAGGVAADRYSKRAVLLYAVLALTASSVAIGVAVEAHVIKYWMLLAASAIQATAFAFYLPARIAFIAELVDAEQIGEAVVVTQTAQEAMRVIAPALAGVLIGVSWFGVGGVFLLAGATSALSTFFVARLPVGAPRVPAARSPLEEIVDALRYVRTRRELSLVALTTIGVVVIGYPYLIFLPALADDRYDVGAGGYGLMAGVAGFGAVIAGLIAPRRSWMVARPWRVIGVSGAALGVALVALGFSSTYWLALLVLLAVGASALDLPDVDPGADAVPVGLPVPRTDAEHGRARVQRVRTRRPAARPVRRRDVPPADARRDGPPRPHRHRHVRPHAASPPPSAGRGRAGVERSALTRSSRRRGTWRPSAPRSGRPRCAGRGAT